jgi:hypothetical protein
VQIFCSGLDAISLLYIHGLRDITGEFTQEWRHAEKTIQTHQS